MNASYSTHKHILRELSTAKLLALTKQLVANVLVYIQHFPADIWNINSFIFYHVSYIKGNLNIAQVISSNI